jgi:HEPN domain-containing protein
LFVYYNEEEPPRTHNIINIFEKIRFKNLQSVSGKLEEYLDFLEELLAFYISERYPSYKERLSAIVDQIHAQQVLFKAKEVFSWLKSLK